MIGRFIGKKLSSFQIIIFGFMGLILVGTCLLMLPVSARTGQWTSLEDALFTSTSAVCVTGLVVHDTGTYWSLFGQTVILILIQIGGLGIVTVAAFIAAVSGRKISLLQRSLLQESISAPQLGGIMKLTRFIFKVAFLVEFVGALLMMPVFCEEYGLPGIWMSFFHSISAFCNAGIDVTGGRTGAYSSMTFFGNRVGLVLPMCLLIIIGGIGFVTWDDIAVHKLRFKRYRMQSKVILMTTLLLILLPTAILFFNDFAKLPFKERICFSVFQAVTPRTAGFNTVDLTSMTSAGRALLIILMLIGGSPGSTAGGMKTTTAAVLFANAMATVRRKKGPKLFRRRVEDDTVKTASTLLVLYLFLTLTAAFFISMFDKIPITVCVFETASAIGTVGLSLGITPSLSLPAHLILIVLMFLGRVGGLTLLYAAISSKGVEMSQYPVEKITVG